MGTKSTKAPATPRATTPRATSSTSTAEPTSTDATSSGSARGARWGELQPAPTTIGALVDLEVAAAREARASDARAPRLVASLAHALLEVEGRRLRGEGIPADEKALRAALKALRSVVDAPPRGMVQTEHGPAVSCAVLPARPDLPEERYERVRALLQVCEEAARRVAACGSSRVGPGVREVREAHPMVRLAANVVRERTLALFGVRSAPDKPKSKPKSKPEPEHATGEWLAKLVEGAKGGKVDAETIARRALVRFVGFNSNRAGEAVKRAIEASEKATAPDANAGASSAYREPRKVR